MPIRVVLGEDSYIVREGVRRLLATADGIDVEAACEDLDSLLREVEDRRPDVVVTDIRMPPTQTDEGIQLAARLRAERPEIGVVVLSHFAEPEYLLALLDSGSDGRAYLLKERLQDLAQLVAAIEAVAAGRSVIDPKIVELLVAAKARMEKSPLAELTPRELEVLAAIAEGKSNAAIADALVLTKRAVEKHVYAIFLKLNLSHAQDAGDVNPRVKAALLFLSEPAPALHGITRQARRPSAPADVHAIGVLDWAIACAGVLWAGRVHRATSASARSPAWLGVGARGVSLRGRLVDIGRAPSHARVPVVAPWPPQSAPAGDGDRVSLSSTSSSHSSSSISISSLKSTSSGTCTLKRTPPRSNSTSLCCSERVGDRSVDLDLALAASISISNLQSTSSVRAP